MSHWSPSVIVRSVSDEAISKGDKSPLSLEGRGLGWGEEHVYRGSINR